MTTSRERRYNWERVPLNICLLTAKRVGKNYYGYKKERKREEREMRGKEGRVWDEEKSFSREEGILKGREDQKFTKRGERILIQ